GSSIKKKLRSLALIIYFIIRATKIAAKNPIRYIAINANPCILKIPSIFLSGTAKDINKIYTGKRAEQLIKGVTIMVIIRSFQFSILRADIIAGTAQAIPLIK